MKIKNSIFLKAILLCVQLILIISVHAQCNTPLSPNYPTNGIVVTSIYDSVNNLVYIGGEFTAVNNWNPNLNNTVKTIAISGNIIYIGGDFTTIGGQVRNYIAAIDAGTGLATAWNPHANDPVHTLAITGSTVYAGGGVYKHWWPKQKSNSSN